MTIKRLQIVILVLLVLLTACASPQTDSQTVGPNSCNFTYWVAVERPNGETVDLKFDSTATWHGPDEDGDYTLVPDDTPAWGAANEQLHVIANRLNEGLSKLYAESEFLEVPVYDGDYLPEALITSYERGDCDWLDGDYHNNRYPNMTLGFHFYEMENSGYITTTRIGDTTAFVKVVSPMGSIVSYSFPVSYLDTIYTWALGYGEKPLEIKSHLIDLPLPSAPDGAAYSQAILEQALGQDSASNEAASFTLNTEDFEGRNELKAVIAKALEIASSQLDGPSVATLHALMSNGQKEKTYATLRGGFVFFGGYVSGESTSEVWFEDVIKASIYIVPVSK